MNTERKGIMNIKEMAKAFFESRGNLHSILGIDNCGDISDMLHCNWDSDGHLLAFSFDNEPLSFCGGPYLSDVIEHTFFDEVSIFLTSDDFGGDNYWMIFDNENRVEVEME